MDHDAQIAVPTSESGLIFASPDLCFHLPYIMGMNPRISYAARSLTLIAFLVLVITAPQHVAAWFDPAQTSRAEPKSGKDPSGPTIATINGRKIGQRDYLRLLVDTHGLGLLQQMILREVVRDAAAKEHVTIQPADIDREYDITLHAAHLNGKDGDAITPARREQLVAEWTESRGVTREELAIAMERQTYLRKLVTPGIEITPEMLKKEYDRVHGEKVEVRHIQLAAQRVWPQVQQRLTQGESFEQCVADFSQNVLTRDRQGLMPPFTREDPTVPAIFAKIAFALEPGQVSNPFEAEKSFHVLKLERRIPAEDVAFESVEETLRKNLFSRLVLQRMEDYGREILMNSRIFIDDPVLRKQYDRDITSGKLIGPPLSR